MMPRPARHIIVGSQGEVLPWGSEIAANRFSATELGLGSWYHLDVILGLFLSPSSP